MQDNESRPEQTSRVAAVNSSNWRRTAIAVVITALITGTSGYLLGIRTNQNTSQSNQRISFQPSPTITAQSAVQLSPTTIPTTTLTGDTVDYALDSQQVYLRYKGDVTIPDNSQYKIIPTNLDWHPIIQAPPTDSQNHRVVFSLYEADNPVFDFMFVMEWDATHYDLYIHKKDGATEKLAAFDITDNGYNVPKINQISLDGNYVALDMYGCWYCEFGHPSILLMNIPTKKIVRIGQVAYFDWKSNGAYDYKEYVTKLCPSEEVGLTDICPEGPQDIPMKRGQFQ